MNEEDLLGDDPELTDGAQVTMGGIIGSYKKINTRTGSSMAFISVEDLYGNIECVAFPSVFDKIKSIVAADKVVLLTGKMQLDDEKAPVIILDKMQEYVPEDRRAVSGGVEVSAKPREHALWLNASELTEEEFDEFISVFSHYENGSMTVKIKRGKNLYKLANINHCRGLLNELYVYLNEKDIVQV